MDTNPLVTNESNFDTEDTQNSPVTNIQDVEADVVKDIDTKDKVSKDAPKQSEAQSGEAIGAHEEKSSKDKSLIDSGKKPELVFPSSLAIDTSLSKAKGKLPEFTIIFDKPYHLMSLVEKVLATATLQAQAT